MEEKIHSQTGKLYILRLQILHKLINRLKTISIKILSSLGKGAQIQKIQNSLHLGAAMTILKKKTGTFTLCTQRTSLAIQWLRLHTSNAGRVGSIPGWGTKISHALRCGQKQTNKKQNKTKPQIYVPGPIHINIYCANLAQRQSDQQKVRESLRTHILHQMIHDKGDIAVQWGKCDNFNN